MSTGFCALLGLHLDYNLGIIAIVFYLSDTDIISREGPYEECLLQVILNKTHLNSPHARLKVGSYIKLPMRSIRGVNPIYTSPNLTLASLPNMEMGVYIQNLVTTLWAVVTTR